MARPTERTLTELPMSLTFGGSSSRSCRYPPDTANSTSVNAAMAPPAKANISGAPGAPRAEVRRPKEAVMVTEKP